jgi:hypothetical protein
MYSPNFTFIFIKLNDLISVDARIRENVRASISSCIVNLDKNSDHYLVGLIWQGRPNTSCSNILEFDVLKFFFSESL